MHPLPTLPSLPLHEHLVPQPGVLQLPPTPPSSSIQLLQLSRWAVMEPVVAPPRSAIRSPASLLPGVRFPCQVRRHEADGPGGGGVAAETYLRIVKQNWATTGGSEAFVARCTAAGARWNPEAHAILRRASLQLPKVGSPRPRPATPPPPPRAG